MTYAVFSPEQLTESQRKAVNHTEGALLVLAGPGSGKTRVITSRIAALIESGVRPWNICAITFTNKAAEEMRDRVAGLAHAHGVHISTFHSLCVRLLRQYAHEAGISPYFSIYDTVDQTRCVKEAIKSVEIAVGSFPPSRMLASISQLKNDLEDVDAFEARAADYYSKVLARVYRAYQRILADNNALDFDDLLTRTAFLLRDNPDVRREIGDRFRYLLVDEYQDTNHAQYQIAKGIALEHGNICVTGDPDQSIYKWRGADIGNILAFEQDWPDATVIKLEENFRSTPNILQLADRLIANNLQRKHKTLIPTRRAGHDVQIRAYPDAETEAEEVAQGVKDLMAENFSCGEIAVFYRVNAMSRVIEEAFVRRQIPYQVIRGVEFYARKEIRDILSYLKVMVNPDDGLAFERALGTHKRGIGKTTIDRLIAWADREKTSLYESARNAHRIDSIAKATQDRLVAFAEMIDTFRQDMTGPVAPLMERVFKESGMAAALEAGGEREEAAIENVGELINAAAIYDKETESPSLADYLQTIALYSDTDAYEPESGRVSLMTLHAAKGLEFDAVFIVGLEEGILPHERSMEFASDIEEERRLFFVGMTRARSRLHISYARHRVVHGQFLRTTPSPFLFEIGYEPDFSATEHAPSLEDGFQYDYADSQTELYRVNELVSHAKFGLGRVKEFIDMGEDSIVVVRFNSGQTKSLMLKYAKLTRPEG
ncbi:MAG TPA: UvrD-helicase domain-containing protein [Anaerohalosphaeraceae bacterium]|jgi:DNA helicase-2/ATP-dependent DNA helicase PcrA|nr:UvrD-helicase domain-containing protein [Anaerohalosphaeraceae bacterium]HRT51962.1 UvrD-helicase domain-containing protein [Anaerohalosphaeraceae bacterium]HRT88018.1 UvrD-helicase domain-containing protein [Anaerohalosphaeraceae bacterium]